MKNKKKRHITTVAKVGMKCMPEGASQIVAFPQVQPVDKKQMRQFEMHPWKPYRP